MTTSLYSYLAAAALLLGVCLTPLAAHAQQQPSDEPTRSDTGEPDASADPDAPAPQRITDVPPKELRRRVERYVRPGQKITIYQVTAEMIDEFTADAKGLNIASVSPLALRGVALSPNLSPAFGQWVASQINVAVAANTNARIKQCLSCQALRTKVEGDEWVVTLGHTTQAELAAEAERIGVVAFIDADLSFFPSGNTVALSLQITRATDGKILWAQTYRSDATTAAILRSGDRVLTRDEAYAELMRKVESKPYYGYQFTAGMGLIPYDSAAASNISGIMIGGRLYEKFGEDRRILYGFHGESFINLSEQTSILGAFVGVLAQYELNQPNLNSPTWRAGGILEGFIAGDEGNSFAIEANLEAILQFRYGASLGLFYFFPTTFDGADLGGPGAKARFIINW